jgi:hypothetical protein
MRKLNKKDMPCNNPKATPTHSKNLMLLRRARVERRRLLDLVSKGLRLRVSPKKASHKLLN